MGTFGGHALPGSFFIMGAIWWTLNIFRRYFICCCRPRQPISSSSKSHTRNKRHTLDVYESSVTFPLPCTCCCGSSSSSMRSWQWEGAVKIFVTVVGFTGEIITGFKDGKFVHLGNGQHATMFFFFGMSGVVDILVHHKIPLPKGSDYAMLTLSFTVEALLFKFHLHGRTALDVLLHTLLLYTIYATILVCLAEMRYRHSPLPALARSFLTFLQGTWFWQVGFILYNPLPGSLPWADEDHKEMMIVTMLFAWHMAAVLIIMLILGSCIGGYYYWCRGLRPVDYSVLREETNGIKKSLLNQNDDAVDSDTSV